MPHAVLDRVGLFVGQHLTRHIASGGEFVPQRAANQPGPRLRSWSTLPLAAPLAYESARMSRNEQTALAKSGQCGDWIGPAGAISS
jgi:hypothetical protein